jgi:hypothetical protein
MADEASLHLTAIQHYIDSLETAERIKYHPHLAKRALNIEIDDVAAENKIIDQDGADASLRNRELKLFSLQLLTVDLSTLLKLDVGNNELSALPGLSSLPNLTILNLRRNWFDALPSDIGSLTNLQEINASRNFLKATHDSLRFDQLKNYYS